jgi:hypothetical protein
MPTIRDRDDTGTASLGEMGEPEAIAALERVGLATSGPVTLFHAPSVVVAAAIEADGAIPGDDAGQVWLASSEKIAPLHHAAGAAGAAEEGERGRPPPRIALMRSAFESA